MDFRSHWSTGKTVKVLKKLAMNCATQMEGYLGIGTFADARIVGSYRPPSSLQPPLLGYSRKLAASTSFYFNECGDYQMQVPPDAEGVKTNERAYTDAQLEAADTESRTNILHKPVNEQTSRTTGSTTCPISQDTQPAHTITF